VRLVEPWPPAYQVNKRSPYGPRRHPITGKVTFHHGVDVACPVGTPLTAPAPGVIVHKNRTASAGFNLIIRHDDNWHTVYYHLQKPSHLPLNKQVQTGEVIAYSGNTGASTGPHLHFELRKSRVFGNTVDPMPYFMPEPSPMLPVTGRPSRESWRAFQQFLKQRGHYRDRIDGIAGPNTHRAIQAWLGVPQTGALDDRTRRALQAHLGVKVDGIWGRLTWSEIQRRLNEGTL
jgi:hypothetical protein